MKIEILMAVYNGQTYLAQQIDSILQQDTEDWHLTISDDGSSDGSMEIVQDYIIRYPNRISRVFPPERFGNARDHFFWLMKSCEADYMLFCDQDDVWHADKVRKTIDALESAENQWGLEMPVLVFTDQTVVDQELNVIASSMMKFQHMKPNVQDYRSLLIENTVTGCTAGINRALADLAGKCIKTEQTIMHDWWIGIVAARFGKMIYLDESTMEYRQHGRNSVGAKNVHSIIYLLDKLLNKQKMHDKANMKKKQAVIFCNTYWNALTCEEREILQGLSAEKIALPLKIKFSKYVLSLLRKIDFLCRW